MNNHYNNTAVKTINFPSTVHTTSLTQRLSSYITFLKVHVHGIDNHGATASNSNMTVSCKE